jgi:branched-chain amino acid aminotransferase
MADELFFTGTAVELAPIIEVDHRPIGSGRIGPVSAKLKNLYIDATRGRLARYQHWLTPAHVPAPELIGG